jgi:hypothetical protein
VIIKKLIRWMWFFIVLTLQACGDNKLETCAELGCTGFLPCTSRHVCECNGSQCVLSGSEPDAAIDSKLDATAIDPCCALLPDEDALRACALPSFPDNTCGVFICPNPDGGFTKISVCGRQIDASVSP